MSALGLAIFCALLFYLGLLGSYRWSALPTSTQKGWTLVLGNLARVALLGSLMGATYNMGRALMGC